MVESQGKVSEKSGNFEMDIEWQPCFNISNSDKTIVDVNNNYADCINFDFNWQHTVHETFWCTVKPVLIGDSKMDKTKILMINGSLMKVKSIAECSPWSILQCF